MDVGEQRHAAMAAAWQDRVEWARKADSAAFNEWAARSEERLVEGRKLFWRLPSDRKS